MKTKNIEKKTKSVENAFVAEILKTPRPIVALSKDFQDGDVIDNHYHDRSQLLYASSGVMTVSTATGVWVVPPLRAIWIPAFTDHQIHCSGRLLMRTLYLEPDLVPGMSSFCQVLSVPPLLRELILSAVDFPRNYEYGSPEERIMQVILDQIQSLSANPLDLPIPIDRKLKEIYQLLIDNPSDNRSIEDWAHLVGTTSRTLTRLFRKEIGMSFRQWRQQIRILEALRQLGRNEPVTSISYNLGYESPSAFIAMFKKALGKTPGQYFQDIKD